MYVVCACVYAVVCGGGGGGVMQLYSMQSSGFRNAHQLNTTDFYHFFKNPPCATIQLQVNMLDEMECSNINGIVQ